MAGNEARLTDGQRWSARQFLDHYSKPSASGMPTPVAGPPEPVNVDMSWYMEDGPGRYYHPGMFPVMDQIVDNRNLAPGIYDLAKLAADEDALKARVSHYRTEIEIKPLDTNFDFEHNTRNPLIEGSRAVGRQILDPDEYGSKYEIQYRGYGRPGELGPDRGIGRIYHPFTDARLSAARRKDFAYPGSAPSGLLPSVTAAPPPAMKEHLQYLDQVNAGQPQAPGARSAMPPFGNPTNQSSWQSLPGASGGTQAQQRFLPPGSSLVRLRRAGFTRFCSIS